MKGLCRLILAIIFLSTFTALSFGSATDIYITPDGSGQGACTNSPHNPAWFNSAGNWGSGASQIGPGTTVHLCGTFTGAAGSTMFTFQGSGTSGSPITLRFESGTQLNAPYWKPNGGGTGCGGAICLYNRSFVTVDGGQNGIIQNTANGDNFANQQPSTGIDGYSCDNCTIKNIAINNIYVHPANGRTDVEAEQMNVISISGSHWNIHDVTFHDCGWCMFNAYDDGDTDINIYNNDMSNFGHAYMFAAASPRRATNFFFHDNRVHDAANWTAAGCAYHNDGLHTFGVTGSSMSGLYIYNNYFYGDWGACPTGFIYIENGNSNPSHASNTYIWNNFGDARSSTIENSNGWFGIFSGETGETKVFNNTILGPTSNKNNTLCFSLQTLKNLSFMNNVVDNCESPVGISDSTIVTIDHNFYGSSCGYGNNCFIWNGQFKGSFSGWKSACNCDSNGVQNNVAKLNDDGSPQDGSPVIGMGSNLMSQAQGNLVTLASDTSKGNMRTPTGRPPSGSWTSGAYNPGSGGNNPEPPTGLDAVVN